MSEEQLKAFLEKVKGDSSLQEKLKAAPDFYAVTAIAKEAGFSISADDLEKAQSELSDKELEGVTGGTITEFQGDHGIACGGKVAKAANEAEYASYKMFNPIVKKIFPV
jgi:predicted ribosomally synthesized peptide with nif11-like leader